MSTGKKIISLGGETEMEIMELILVRRLFTWVQKGTMVAIPFPWADGNSHPGECVGRQKIIAIVI